MPSAEVHWKKAIWFQWIAVAHWINRQLAVFAVVFFLLPNIVWGCPSWKHLLPSFLTVAYMHDWSSTAPHGKENMSYLLISRQFASKTNYILQTERHTSRLIYPVSYTSPGGKGEKNMFIPCMELQLNVWGFIFV